MPDRPSQYVDISQWPADEKAHVVEFAKRHNALNEDVDNVTGRTPEEKEDSWHMFGLVRFVTNWLHQRRFSMALVSFQVWIVVQVLNKLGVDTTHLGPTIEKIISTVMGFQ